MANMGKTWQVVGLLLACLTPVCWCRLDLCRQHEVSLSQGIIGYPKFPSWVEIPSCACNFTVPKESAKSIEVDFRIQLLTREAVPTCHTNFETRNQEEVALQSCPLSQDDVTTTGLAVAPGNTFSLVLTSKLSVPVSFHVVFSTRPTQELEVKCGTASVMLLAPIVPAHAIQDADADKKKRDSNIATIVCVVIIVIVVGAIITAALLRKKCAKPDKKKLDRPKENDDNARGDNPAYEFTPKSSVHNLTLDSLFGPGGVPKQPPPFTGSADLGVPKGPYQPNGHTPSTRGGTPWNGSRIGTPRNGSIGIPFDPYGPATIDLTPYYNQPLSMAPQAASPRSAVLEPGDYDPNSTEPSPNNKSAPLAYPNSAYSPQTDPVPLAGMGALGNDPYFNQPYPRMYTPPASHHPPYGAGPPPRSPGNPFVNDSLDGDHPNGVHVPRGKPNPPGLPPDNQHTNSPNICPGDLPSRPDHPHELQPQQIQPQQASPVFTAPPGGSTGLVPKHAQPPSGSTPSQHPQNPPGGSTRPTIPHQSPTAQPSPSQKQTLPQGGNEVPNKVSSPVYAHRPVPAPFNVSFDDLKFIDDEDQDAWVRLGHSMGTEPAPRRVHWPGQSYI